MEPLLSAAVTDYGWKSAGPTWDDSAIWRVVHRELVRLPGGSRVFDLGCGNGVNASRLAEIGLDVTAVDPSPSGIALATSNRPGVRFEVGGADDDLASQHGVFDAVVSLEVVEHCYSPARFAACVRSLLAPDGIAVISTPYHGYWKNLAIALAGRMDAHHDPLREGGHIKFFSIATLTRLLEQHGLAVDRVHRVGRIPPLAKSMVLVARRLG